MKRELKGGGGLKEYVLKDDDLEIKMSGGSSFLDKVTDVGKKLSSGMKQIKELKRMDKKVLSQLFKILLFIKILEFFKLRAPPLLLSLPAVQQATILVSPNIEKNFTLFCDNAILELKNKYREILDNNDVSDILVKYVEDKATKVVQEIEQDVDDEVSDVKKDGISEKPEIEFEIGNGKGGTYVIKIEKKK